MAKSKMRAAGGPAAVWYVFKKGREAGGIWKLYKRLRSRNACKTCALGMGGQKGGMVNEAGHFPEVCKKSVQAQAGDMAGVIEESYFKQTSLAKLATLTSGQLEKLGRLTFPVIAAPGDTHFRRISWTEALDRTGDALRKAPPGEVFFYSSGRSSNEAAFLFQLVARAYGTPHIHNCSYYCHAASGVALAGIYGTGTASVRLEDLAEADLAVVAGANPASNHPRLITQLVDLRKRGGTVIVVNPLRELGLQRFRVPSKFWSMLFGSKVANLYLQPHVGSDIALYKAFLKGLLEAQAIDEDFIAAHTAGWDEVRADIDASPWDALLGTCGITRAEVDAVVEKLTRAKRGILFWSMGLTHHAFGVDNIRALGNVALARGWLGKPGCGLVPIRGHSNVQGVGTVGVSPHLKESFAQKLEEIYGISVPRDPGQDTYASMVAATEGKIAASLQLGGNLFGSNPDREWSGVALTRVPFSACITTKMNEGHIHGRAQTMILMPALARDEESQVTTQESMFNYVRLSEGGTPAVAGEMRSEVDIIASLAERILPAGKFDWATLHSHHALRDAIAKVVPGMAEVAKIDATKQEFLQIAWGATFHRAPLRHGRRAGPLRGHRGCLPIFAPPPASFAS